MFGNIVKQRNLEIDLFMAKFMPYESDRKQVVEDLMVKGHNPLGYNEDFSELIKVVERIETLKNEHGSVYRVFIVGNSCYIESHNASIVEMIVDVKQVNKHEAVLHAVGEFVDYYNKKQGDGK